MKNASLLLIALLPACSVSTPQSGELPGTQALTKTQSSHAVAAQSKHLVYVSSQSGSGSGQVYVYDARGQGQKPIATIVNGISAPAGIAVDSSGNLYVANSGNSTVTVYPPGTTTPSATYTSGVNTPYGVAVGSDGTLYVANLYGGSSGGGSVTEYPAGNTLPNVTVTLAGENAVNLALDAENRLYVSWFSLSSFTITIYKYPTEGSSSGSNLNLNLPPGVFPAYAIAFDDKGNLVVPVENLYHTSPKYLGIFAPGATQPKRKIRDRGLLDVVSGIAFSREHPGIFYVTAENDHDWLKLTYPGAIPRDVVNVGLPTGLALSP